MKIKNYDGRSWISKWAEKYGYKWMDCIHIANAEVESAELKGTQLVIRVSTRPRTR